MGTRIPRFSSPSTMAGTAAAASSLFTVTRTISDPARASASTCSMVHSASAVPYWSWTERRPGLPSPRGHCRSGPWGFPALNFGHIRPHIQFTRSYRWFSTIRGSKKGSNSPIKPGIHAVRRPRPWSFRSQEHLLRRRGRTFCASERRDFGAPALGRAPRKGSRQCSH